ncbi:MAG: hypothetical protein NT038_07980 [Euryarchaeota archaeon]|nr:hypothetical protein [Euryarchaeota archaeon]
MVVEQFLRNQNKLRKNRLAIEQNRLATEERAREELEKTHLEETLMNLKEQTKILGNEIQKEKDNLLFTPLDKKIHEVIKNGQ